MQVAVEIRLLSVPVACADHHLSEICPELSNPSPVKRGTGNNGRTWTRVAFLTPQQVSQFIARAQENPRTNVMQAPKMTLMDGQSSKLSIADDQYFVTGLVPVHAADQVVLVPENRPYRTGFWMAVRPKVSADRRHVRVSLNAQLTDLVSVPVPLVPITTMVRPVQKDGTNGEPVAFTQFLQQPEFKTLTGKKTFSVPDGGSMLLSGWKSVRPVSQTESTPVLSKIPYVGPLFDTETWRPEDVEVLVLVTPRIIVEEEEEQKLVRSAPTPCQHANGTVVQAAATEPALPMINRRSPACDAASASRLQKLLAQYELACSKDEPANALRLAVEALACDPTCFSKKAISRPRQP
jgi:type II secretory pathway component GspD/PulD (secretin)